MRNEEYVNYYLFWLFHLGISNTTLSKIYHSLTLNDLKKIYAGRFGDYAINNIKFTNKELELLSNKTLFDNSKSEVNALMIKFMKENVKLLFFYDIEYPNLLKQISNPPIFLFVKGNFQKLNDVPLISIAGTRKISRSSAKNLSTTVTSLVQNSYGIVSGLAIGTDVIANRVAYEQKGYSVAVIPSSIFSIQPKSNAPVAFNILKNGGVIISEYYTEKVDKSRFINRNRIIAGLGKALLIPEFNVRSGTMHTARFAWRQQKPIFTFNNNSTGVRTLLDGRNAYTYESVDSLIKILGVSHENHD